MPFVFYRQSRRRRISATCTKGKSEPDDQDFAVCPTVLAIWHTARVSHELEDRIQQLCARIAATDNDEELNDLCVELKRALNEHIGFLRRLVADFRSYSKKHLP